MDKCNIQYQSSGGENAAHTEEDTSTVKMHMHDLPWHDVIFTYILPKLHLADLFRLRASSKTLYKCINEYIPMMRHLNLAYVGPKFNSVHLRSITKNCYMLQNLDLSAAKQWLHNDLVEDIIKQNEYIESINLRGCVSLQLGLLESLGINCKGLKQVDFGNCVHVTSEEVVQMVQECTQLEYIDLSGCWNINDATIASTVCRNKQLRYIDISNVYSITDAAISAIACNCANLKVLKIKACWRVTNDGIRMLGEYCKHLNVLHVKDCRSITDVSLARLRARGILIDIPMRGFIHNTNFNNAFSQAEHKLDILFSTLKLQV